MGLFSRKHKNDSVLSSFDGRCVKYVTRRDVDSDGNVSYNIIGKSGRIAVVDGKIRVICGETDVFTCEVSQSKYYLLLSGDGVTVEGQNLVTGKYDSVTAYYTYYRK